MWIGSSRQNKTKALGIKWPDEPMKALGLYYSYDPKSLHGKNFIEKLDSIKKLINIWSSRGLSIYGKVTIIKPLIIPKFVYIVSLLPTPRIAIKELNQLLFKFLLQVPTMPNLSHDFDEKSDFLNYEFPKRLPAITPLKNGLVQKRQLGRGRM